MKPLLLVAGVFALCATSTTQAEAKVTNIGQAFAACKLAIHQNHADVQQVKLLSARKGTRPYTLKVRIKRNGARQKSLCLVTRDGGVQIIDK